MLRKGFAVSSALGKLRLFRAVREDKAVSLLHIAILAAAGAEATLDAMSLGFASLNFVQSTGSFPNSIPTLS